MANPFATQTVIDPATDKQITLADKLIREREWHNGGEHYVRRTAALSVVLDWSLNPMADRTPAEISRLINNTVGRVGSYVMKTDGSTPVRTTRLPNLISPLGGRRGS